MLRVRQSNLVAQRRACRSATQQGDACPEFVASSTGGNLPTRTIARQAVSRLVKTGAIHTAHVAGYKRG
ncbi:hypothetical protein [Paraburkholderia hospita]|uniref:hypothetical protein n=1 Tax=Paraburkholderia hospita TaxID=169430 RepID=UPI000B34983F|nr:hypothetical protein [Paraburkholderia hospita]OUL70925.1 hypothetical protein CA601_46750 [Paraburkholderia hospita]